MDTERIRSGNLTGSSGYRLRWDAAGDGAAIVCCNGLGVSTFFWKYVVEHFSKTHTVVTWDYVGHGRSEHPARASDVDTRMEAFAEDLGSVIAQLDLGPAVLLGHSMGCQVILERALQQPDDVAAVVPILGTAGRILDTFQDSPMSYYVFRVVQRLANHTGALFTDVVQFLVNSPLAFPFTRFAGQLDRHYGQRDDFAPYLEHLGQFDPHLFLSLVWSAHCHDLFPRLGDVTCPALIIAGERDDFTPLWTSRKMAATLPDAELMVLAQATHAALIEQPEDINCRLERFLRERVETPPPEP